MKRLIFIVLASVLILSSAGSQESDFRHLSVNAGLMVFDRRAAADSLGDWAERQGGYFVWKSDEAVQLRVPDDAVDGLRSFLDETGDSILNFGRSSVDLREEMMRHRSALQAREEILEKNIELLDSSDVAGTLELEREIRRLMAEIDASRGYLNKLEHDAAMAMVNVNLSFRQQTVPVDRPSRFAWINSVDFYDFMAVYPAGGASAAFKGAPIPTPEGFAKIRGTENFMALSPEGIRLSIREVKNYPQQNVSFWIQALETDLQLRGYLPMEIEDEHDWGGGQPFVNQLWAVPLGNEDYLYLTAIRVTGKDLEILEMAGKAEYMSRYLE